MPSLPLGSVPAIVKTAVVFLSIPGILETRNVVSDVEAVVFFFSHTGISDEVL